MNITLTSEQEDWCKNRVLRGDFGSVEDAALQLINERIAEREANENDEFLWAKPFIDEALAQVEQGQIISLEEHKRRTEMRFLAMKS